jgi:hypothetical protein
MGGRSRPSDAIVLTLRERAAGAGDPRRRVLHHATAFGQAEPPRTLLFGFASGTELIGLAAGADEGLALTSAAEVAAEPALADPDLLGPIYRLRFDHYLDRLARAGVNYAKVLVFDAFKPRWSPYATDGDGIVVGGDVAAISAAFLDRLEELTRAARARGIVVCLSLFSSRMLRGAGWASSPFNARNNNTGDALGNGSFIEGAPLERFCVIREPSPGRRFAAMSTAEKLYLVQRELVTRLVETTRRYWNVVYELCDDARGPGEPGAMTEVVEWHVTVAGWIASLLRDGRGRRRRCLEVDASPRLRGALLDALGAREDAAGDALVDLVHLRGHEWGGYPGASHEEACALRSHTDPGDRLLAASAIGAGITHREIAWDGVDQAIARLARRPVAAVLDSEAHHLAQKYPRRYVEAARARWAHLLHRFTPAYLHSVDVEHESCTRIGAQGQACPAKGRAGYHACVTLGLDQRLEQCTAADPEGRVSAFPLPPPADPPRLLEATVVEDHLELRFDAPPVEPEAYAVFLGASADEVWAGTERFPDPLPVVRTPGGGRVALPPVSAPVSFFVAVAATRGVLTSDLSEALGPLTLVPSGARLVAADLPAEIASRRDFHGSVSFVNASAETWRGPEVGVLVEADGLSGGLARLFFPLIGENLGGRPDVVPPGATVTVDLRRIRLEGAFAELYGVHMPVLLPYAHLPLRFRITMVRRSELEVPDAERPEVELTPLGPAEVAFPDGRPLTTRVREPRRLATRYVPEAQTLVRDDFVLPLADAVDGALTLASITAKEGPPGAIIRSWPALERLARAVGLPTRALHVRLDGNASVAIEIDVVKLHAIDVYYGLRARAPLRRSHSLAARASEQLPLGLADHSLTIGLSDTPFSGGDAVRWELLANRGAEPDLRLTNDSAHPVKLVSFTAQLVEDGATERFESRSFAAGETLAYLPLGEASGHAYHLHGVRVLDGPGTARSQVVLRADEKGVFQRELEVSLEGGGAGSIVEVRTLEVSFDASPARTRTAADLHPAHAARILRFFNEVDDAAQIVATIRDNRAYHRDTRRAYAIRPALAASILKARGKLLSDRFVAVQDIESITGVGPDTFEDIAFTFEDDATPL